MLSHTVKSGLSRLFYIDILG